MIDAVQLAVDLEGVTMLATDIDQDGGKIILTTGVPTARVDDEGRMLRAARRIVDSPTHLSVKVGVNRGHVFAGEVGNQHRRTYTVMGDTVNLAARLMSQATTGQILTTVDVLTRSGTTFDATPLEPFMVKGKVRPVQASAVGPAVVDHIAVVGTASPLVGREDELAELAGAWASAAGGSGRMVELVGEAGIGKSRLLEEVLARAEGAVVLRAECRVYQSATAVLPVPCPAGAGLYEEALLRRLRGEVARRAGAEPDADDVQEAERLLHLLGIVEA